MSGSIQLKHWTAPLARQRSSSVWRSCVDATFRSASRILSESKMPDESLCASKRMSVTIGRDRYFVSASRTCRRDCPQRKSAKPSPLQRRTGRQSTAPRSTALLPRGWSPAESYACFCAVSQQIRPTSNAAFLASPLEEGERTEVRGLQILRISLSQMNPHPPPLPVEGEATRGRPANSI